MHLNKYLKNVILKAHQVICLHQGTRRPPSGSCCWRVKASWGVPGCSQTPLVVKMCCCPLVVIFGCCTKAGTQDSMTFQCFSHYRHHQQSMGSGSRRVGHDWATSLSPFIFMLWRRKWQPIPVFLPGESQGWGRRVRHNWSDLAVAVAVTTTSVLIFRAFLVAQSVKNLPAMQETWAQLLGRFPGEANSNPRQHSRCVLENSMDRGAWLGVSWRISWTEEPGRLQSMGLQELDTT